MNTLLQTEEANDVSFEQKIRLLKESVCADITDDEMHLFIMQCRKMDLDPFAKHVYPVKRWNQRLQREAMVLQTGIDGYRLIADRTGCYAPGKAADFGYDDNGALVYAVAYVKKQTADGTWHEHSAKAYFSEYAGRDRSGKLTQFWVKMPHVMLAKCAEALALRQAFPAQLNGLYIKEEMDQSENPGKKGNPGKKEPISITSYQAEFLNEQIGENDQYRGVLMNFLKKEYDIDKLEKMPALIYDRVVKKVQEVNKETVEEVTA